MPRLVSRPNRRSIFEGVVPVGVSLSMIELCLGLYWIAIEKIMCVFNRLYDPGMVYVVKALISLVNKHAGEDGLIEESVKLLINKGLNRD